MSSTKRSNDSDKKKKKKEKIDEQHARYDIDRKILSKKTKMFHDIFEK